MSIEKEPVDDTSMSPKQQPQQQPQQHPHIDSAAIWGIVESYFRDIPQALVQHQVDSYDDFFDHGIYQMFREKNPMVFETDYDDTIQMYRQTCKLYLGGKDGTKIHIGKPTIHEKGRGKYMFPNEARLRNMTYAMTVHYDIDVEFTRILREGEEPSMMQGGAFWDHVNHGTADVVMETPIDNDTAGGGPKAKPTVKATPDVVAQLRRAAEESVRAAQTQTTMTTIENLYLGRFPIMLQSKYCILHGLPREAKFQLGECLNDLGGYFVIDGKEKVIVPQEKLADNLFNIRRGKRTGDPAEHGDVGTTDADAAATMVDDYLYSAEIRSVSENIAKPIRSLSVRMMAPTASFTNRNIVVNIANVRKPIPLFVLFRALGVLSDYDIVATCLLDMDKYADMVDLFVPSIHDSGGLFTQHDALHYIGSLTKGKTPVHAMAILADYLLPHVGETNFRAKALYLGMMVFRMLSVYTGIERPTDRDHFKCKRVELSGSLIGDLFREYYQMQLKEIYVDFEKRLYYRQGAYGQTSIETSGTGASESSSSDNLEGLIMQNYREVFREHRVVDTGFRKAFKGNWGAQTHTKRVGVVQDLNRLSFNTMISHLRKVNLPMDSSLKVVAPRLLHNSQWGYIDPIDTPDGGNIGFHKNMAIACEVSRGYSRETMIQWLRTTLVVRLLDDCTVTELAYLTRIIVNGHWMGSIEDPMSAVNKFRMFRRQALIPIHTSITFDMQLNMIFIYTDAGRLIRPIFYVDPMTQRPSYDTCADVRNLLKKGEYTWQQLTMGRTPKRIPMQAMDPRRIYDMAELYGPELAAAASSVSSSALANVGSSASTKNDKILADFRREQAVVEYIDCSETETTLIALNADEYAVTPKQRQKLYTHCEIHESLILGVMCNQVAFPETNPLARNLFSTGQSKQACSLYHTNYRMRMDKTAIVLNYGQAPLVQSRYLELINHNENPYGENAMVAIMCYTGYNVEDAVLVNEGALQRGLFQTTYFSTYEAHEEDRSSGGDRVTTDKHFTNIERAPGVVVGLKPGYDYSQLDESGMIRRGTPIHDKTILIGLTATTDDDSSATSGERRLHDVSKGTKKGQVGFVDQTFMTEDETGQRIAKVRVLEQRTPTLGDKFASRVGQKGTIGMVIREADMPFTREGLRPDMIVNPHALPSRMTVGQLVESITGKACALYGGIGDCTAFHQKGSKIGTFGEMLVQAGFHSTGNEYMYNGMTGERMETEVFVGPTYYMRLKHMVKDKINYRALGPRTQLTKQPVSGRANDGGLRIGEMERDSLLGNGMSAFITESMMERGDKYYLAICNRTGMIAIYNPDKNVFLSPIAEDEPAKFIESPFGLGKRSGPGDDGYHRDGGSGNTETDVPHIETVSRFGRDFSIVRIPYALKLMIQELQAMNVVLRLITEDNIHQLSNLAYRTLIPLVKQVSVKQASVKQASVKSDDAAYVKTQIKRTQAALRQEESGDQSSNIRISVLSSPSSLSSLSYRSKGEKEEEEAEDEEEESRGPMKRLDLGSKEPEWPASPSEPPPSSSELSGERFSETRNRQEPNEPIMASTFVIGEPVRYIGDNKPTRIWMVRDIAPETNMVTIETEDTEGLSSEKDSIRVVVDPAKQLYRLPASQSSSPSMVGGRIPWSNESSPISGMPPGIVFAPNIHVGNTFGPSPGFTEDMPSAPTMMSLAPTMPVPPPLFPLTAPPTSSANTTSDTGNHGRNSSGSGSGGGGILQSIMDLGKSFTVRKAE